GSGGGIGSKSGSVVVTDSTISDNVARGVGGGGIFAYSMLVNNSTISGNSASGTDSRGGGIWAPYFGGFTTLVNSAINGNWARFEGGGLLGAARLSHTILAETSHGAAATPNDVIGRVILAYSLLGVGTNVTIIDNVGSMIGTAAAPLDPLLGPLAK